MWISEHDIEHAWGNVKSFMGHAWSHGHKFLNNIDRFANIGQRLLGAAAASGMRGKALEAGLEASNQYDQVKRKAQKFGADVDTTVDRFRKAVPELQI